MDDRTPKVGELPVAPDTDAALARFAPDADDAVGLAAYALHRRALIDFRAGFMASRARAPSREEEAVFMLGECTEARIAAYRDHAQALFERRARRGTTEDHGGQGATTCAPPRKARWPFFGLWVDAPMAPSATPEMINWRGLFGRLVVLLLAVMVTALLLRILVVRG